MSENIKGFCLHGREKILPGSEGSVIRNTSVIDMEIPELKAGEILAKTLYTGICGSDNSACLGKSNFDWVERPRVIGHEFSAEILELGPGDHGDIKVGDVFTPLAMLGCQDEDCPACGISKWNLCPQKQIIGFHRNGGFGQRVVLESDRIVPLMEGLTPAQGALVEPLSIITNALYNKCAIKPGDDVVVTGCGIIGLMSAEVARASGARVAITGIAHDRDIRLKKAKERESNFKSIPGLIQKYYVKTSKEGEYGGVYVWDSAQSLQNYQESDLAKSIPSAYAINAAPDIEMMDMETYENILADRKLVDEEIRDSLEAGQSVLFWQVAGKILIKQITENA